MQSSPVRIRILESSVRASPVLIGSEEHCDASDIDEEVAQSRRDTRPGPKASISPMKKIKLHDKPSAIVKPFGPNDGIQRKKTAKLVRSPLVRGPKQALAKSKSID